MKTYFRTALCLMAFAMATASCKKEQPVDGIYPAADTTAASAGTTETIDTTDINRENPDRGRKESRGHDQDDTSGEMGTAEDSTGT